RRECARKSRCRRPRCSARSAGLAASGTARRRRWRRATAGERKPCAQSRPKLSRIILYGGPAITKTSDQRAILFADVCDSTSIYETVGDAKALALINRLFKALDKHVNVNGGVTVKTMG